MPRMCIPSQPGDGSLQGQLINLWKIGEVANDDIIGDNMETYFLGGNKEWTEEIVNYVNYEAIGSYMGSLSGPRATNVIKFAHDWKNDGQQ